METPFRYTKEHIDYLKEITSNHTSKEIVRLFNNKFSLNKSKRQVDEARWKRGINLSKENKPTAFQKGVSNINKGKKGLQSSNSGSFKSGINNKRYRSIGSEGLDTGYITIKIADPDVWQRKHIILWEGVNGPIPINHRVIFADGNKRNFKLDNLLLVSIGQLNRLSLNGLKTNDTELTKSMLNVVKIYEAIDERMKDK